MKSFVKNFGMPLVYFGCGALLVALDFNPILAYIIMGACMLITARLERYLPFSEEWNLPQQEASMDVGYLALSLAVDSVLVIFPLLSAGYIAMRTYLLQVIKMQYPGSHLK